MPTRTILHARDTATLELWYGKRNPSTGVYYTDADITAATAAVYAPDGTQLLAPAAMSYVANLRGRRLAWTYGAALDGIDIVYVVVTPTRAGGVAAALAPDEVTPIDVSDVQREVALVKADTAALETEASATTRHTALIAEHDATQATLATMETEESAETRHTALIAEHDATQATLATKSSQESVDALQTDFNTFEGTNQGEHDATQSAVALVQADTYAIASRLPVGMLAASAEVVAIQNNTRVVRVVPDQILRTAQTYKIRLYLYDSTGNMETPDSAPTIQLTNQSGTDRSARLNSTTMTELSPGSYEATYTADPSHPIEQLVWAFTVTEGGVARKYGNATLIVDAVAVDFTAADRVKLDTLHDTRLTAPRANALDLIAGLETEASAANRHTTNIAEHDATQSTLATKSSQASVDTANTHLTGIKGTGWSATTDTLEKIRDENVAEHDATQTTLATKASQASVGLLETEISAEDRHAESMAEHTTTQNSITGIATAVWAVGTRTLTSYGTLVVDIWGHSTRTLTSFGNLANTTAAAVWASGTRTLTSFGTLATDVSTAVWTAGTRSLTTFGTIVSDTATAVWVAGTRTLTSHGTVAADAATAVWASSTRTLTSFGTLVADAATAVWAAGARTLTAFGFSGAVADAVWDEQLADHLAAGSTGSALWTSDSDPNAIAAAVWASATRTLTSVSDVMNTQGYSAARAALLDRLDATVTSRAAAGDAMTLSAAQREAIANAILDLASAVESGLSVRAALRIILSSAAGKLSGAESTEIRIRDTADTKDRIVAVVDSDGNRINVTVDGA